MSKFFIGLMSGTSLDGVDIAIIDCESQKPTLKSSYFCHFPKGLLNSTKALCRQTNVQFDELGKLDAQLGDFFAECIQKALLDAKILASEIIAIGSHGQTIQHNPNSSPPYSLQIGDANRIAHATNITVIADFRRRDIAADGQGAPLVPGFHKAVFQNDARNIAIINIGGIANVTFLNQDADEPLIGFDCGPGNTLMDQWCQQYFDAPYDKDGALSENGSINHELLISFLTDPYFELAHPKSTGPEHFNLKWVQTHLSKHPTNPENTLSTLCELTAFSIAQSLEKLPTITEVLVCGGGVHNTFLKERLSAKIHCPVKSTEHYGIDPDCVEAMAFAWLAKQTMEGKTGNAPSVTGANKAVVLGAIYPA